MLASALREKRVHVRKHERTKNENIYSNINNI
nr:MAG TPA: hypothetical protein [Caudoviricetes sp.]